MMNMEKVNQLINESRGTARKDEYSRMDHLLQALGHPEKDLKFVHIAGTNGKGSASVMVESVLRQAGYRTCLFTSPHMEALNERFRIDNTNISDEDLIALTDQVWQEAEKIEAQSGEQFYSFDLQTAMTFVYAKQAGADVVILETGIGGTLDVTNIIPQSEISLIMSIGMDHQGILGDTLEEIASQKAGIIKPGGLVVTYPQPAEIEKIYQDQARKQGATWIRVREEDVEVGPSSLNQQTFSYKDLKDLQTQLPGRHQAYNGAVVVEAMDQLRQRGWQVSESDLRLGIQQAFMPGRMEKIYEDPIVILDGAHNMDGNRSLKANLQDFFPGKKVNFVMGSLDDKEAGPMIQNLQDSAQSFFLIAPNSSRAIQPEELQAFITDPSIPVRIFSSPEEVAQAIKAPESKGQVFVVCGSLYLVGDMRIAMRES